MKQPAESFKKSKKNNPRICSGCGTQVIAGGEASGSLFSTGVEAVSKTASKKAARKARYADLGESNNFLCQRCKNLKKNDIWAAYDAIADVDAKIFTKQLGHIVSRRRFGMCIVVADSTDAEHSAPKNLRQSIGNLPCVLVLSKCDLLPRMESRDVTTLVRSVRRVSRITVIKTFAVSAHTGVGILDLAEYLLLNLGGRDIFCVGAANVGKSTLVQKLANTITPNIFVKGNARKAQRRKKDMSNVSVTASHLPGTTLQAVRVPCFASDRHALWDTPGIIQRKAVQYNLFPPHLMEPLTRAQPIQLAEKFRVRQGESILIEAAWMDSQGTQDEDGTENIDTAFSDGHETAIPPLSRTCVLGRVDIVRVKEGRDILIRPFLHPSLRVRVVKTEIAPSTANIPDHHIKYVQSRMRKAFPEDLITSRPLSAFISPDHPKGELIPTDKEKDSLGERVYMDLCFASLGWLSMTHRDTFTLIPWCVEGSVFSKRRALYPMNISETDVEDQRLEWAEEIEHLDSEEASRKLHDASKIGRKNSGTTNISEGRNDNLFDDGEFIYDDEDEWYV
jgi:GTPase Era involved in 16S rRNA processing